MFIAVCHYIPRSLLYLLLSTTYLLASSLVPLLLFASRSCYIVRSLFLSILLVYDYRSSLCLRFLLLLFIVHRYFIASSLCCSIIFSLFVYRSLLSLSIIGIFMFIVHYRSLFSLCSYLYLPSRYLSFASRSLYLIYRSSLSPYYSLVAHNISFARRSFIVIYRSLLAHFMLPNNSININTHRIDRR